MRVRPMLDHEKENSYLYEEDKYECVKIAKVIEYRGWVCHRILAYNKYFGFL